LVDDCGKLGAFRLTLFTAQFVRAGDRMKVFVDDLNAWEWLQVLPIRGLFATLGLYLFDVRLTCYVVLSWLCIINRFAEKKSSVCHDHSVS